MLTAIPELETERTIMRAWQEADLDAVAAWSADPAVMSFVGGVRGRASAWRDIAAWLGHWSLRGYGLWAVERRADGMLLGRVGLWNPEGWPGVEVGWTLARHAWGQGYATECGAAALAWGLHHHPELERIISIIAPENAASRRVAQRLGMTELGPFRLLGQLDTILYGIDRPGSTTRGS